MFYNVVNNAVKNTPSGGEVIIKVIIVRNNFTVHHLRHGNRDDR